MRTLSKLVTMKTAAIGPKDQHALNMAHTITMKNLNESIVTVMKHILQPSKEEKFDFSELMNLACMPVYKMLEAHSNPLIFNRQITYGGEKTWNAVVEGCLSQVILPVNQEPMYHPLGAKSKDMKPKLLFLKEGEDPEEKQKKEEEEFNAQ
jgi:hypothetical protein